MCACNAAPGIGSTAPMLVLARGTPDVAVIAVVVVRVLAGDAVGAGPA